MVNCACGGKVCIASLSVEAPEPTLGTVLVRIDENTQESPRWATIELDSNGIVALIQELRQALSKLAA